MNRNFENYAIFKLICKAFGHKFSFHAVNLATAEAMKREWGDYQSFNAADFSVEETTDSKRIHDEYFSRNRE